MKRPDEKTELKVYVNRHELGCQHMMPFEAGNVNSLKIKGPLN